ncbi:fatty acid-binding protein, intestinal [Anas platyrhynchos]|uniref:Fatty acid-binding protein, intestinal n=1 Tax=Anas platyrhynchos TaxID=8839 RepID=G1FHQ9_ANAPL|nr:fatty acid-binding protein, intestinal [Anas platyrhynchos]AEL17174.1 intestinal fatty acid binding protein [Anas platyrhynchos]|eukprot:NP_001297272.1 fatty acid-binding protein, intestinal [Anas platyrhynchos]
MAFNGTWKVDRNENYEKFMETMGVNVMKRKLGAHDNLKITIQQDGNKFIVKESSNFRTIDIEFTLGVSFEYTLADGTELTGSWNLEGDKLVGTFTRKDNGKPLKAYREIVGDELVQTYVYEGVEAKRFFKKC